VRKFTSSQLGNARGRTYDAAAMLCSALIRDPKTGKWSQFRRPVETVCVVEAAEVVGALRRVEEAAEKRGLTAVGYIAYEAAPAFDSAFRAGIPADGLPLLCFGLFEAGSAVDSCRGARGRGYTVGSWTPSQDRANYRRSIERIRESIADGVTYQVNHTFRLRASFSGDPESFFADLVASQPRCHGALLDLGDRIICSASPELMLHLEGGRIVSRPMKGTADRGHDLASDRSSVDGLRRSEKNRAENAMIVDMVRNDLGRVAEPGTIHVSGRFDVERHPTVLQMTSTVEAETRAGIADILSVVFPFASVTGAPKIRTMELISELEDEPRGLYTGAIGVIRPDRRARFSVGIRTAVIDRAAGTVEYGVGSGVVWDSDADAEYDECLAKARILSEPVPDFELLETMLWEPGRGFFLLDRHLDRLAGAAEYFGRPFDRKVMSERFRTVPGPQFRSCHRRASTPLGIDDNSGTADLAPTILLRVRVLLAADGSLRVETDPIELEADPTPVRLGLARESIDADDCFLYFKTTNRGVYERARASRPDCDDVLLWNERGEVTESTIANLVAKIDGDLVTPPLSSGLLAGTFRAELLDRGEISERVVRVEDLQRAEQLYLINSVQQWRRAVWVGR